MATHGRAVQALEGKRSDYDAMIHIDETRALEPLEIFSEHAEEAPETFSTGM